MNELEYLLDGLSEPRLLVLGDLMLDRFVWGEAERISPEAAALVLRWQREEARPGGAGNVALLAQTLGAKVSVAGVIGDDDSSWKLRRLFSDAGIDRSCVLHDPHRPTTVKQRFIAASGTMPTQQLLRLDNENRMPLDSTLVKRLARLVLRQVEECNALLVADHGKGLCCPELLGEVFQAAVQRDLPVLVDPAYCVDFTSYRGADLLLPNRREAALAARQPIHTTEQALAAAHQLCERVGVPAVLLKLDADGMVLVEKDQPERIFPARAKVVRDVTGAGDMVLAVLGLCAACGVTWDRAAELASVAAGLQVGWPGSAPLTREELRAALGRCGSAGKVVTVEHLVGLAEGYRRQQRRLVLTNGCFDLLHAGHADYLEQAAALGDVLVVALNDDASVRRLKGEGRPVVKQADRAALLAAFGCVDHVTIFSADTPHEVLRRVRPDVLVKGGDYTLGEVIGSEVVRSYGGQVHVTGKRKGLSSSALMAAVRSQAAFAEA